MNTFPELIAVYIIITAAFGKKIIQLVHIKLTTSACIAVAKEFKI